MYPQEVEKAKRDIIKGRYGKDARDIMTRYPLSEVDISREIYRCQKCGNLQEALCVSIDPPGRQRTTVLKRCGKCKGIMQQVTDENNLQCPVCHSNLEIIGLIMWD